MEMMPPLDAQDAKIAGNQLCFVQHGPDRLAMLIDAINAAQRTLRLYYYIFDDDAAGHTVRDALTIACQRGVAVTLLIDGFGSQETGSGFFDTLEASGATVNWFVPKLGRRFLLRNHQKMLIADDDCAIIGGFNIDNDYFKIDPKGNHWHDFALRIEGHAAQRLVPYFDGLAAWIGSDKPRLKQLTQLLSQHSEKKGPLRWMMGGPFRRLSPMVRQLKADLDHAVNVDMIQAYFAPNPGFLRRLGRVARRGHFRLISAARSDNVTTIAAARHCYRRLLRNRAEIHEFTAARLHGKLIIADNVVWIGSANFDMRSLYLNSEIALRIDNAAFAKAMRKMVDAHLPHCEAITPATLKAGMGIFSSLWRRLSYYIVASLDFRLARNLNWKR
jgi:cardiolipin synthase A/B